MKIEAFESGSYSLPETVDLSPPLLFVRGMAYHLEQAFDDAFRMWDLVTVHSGSDPVLRSLTWYWIGYEQNNLGNFEAADGSFQKALATEDGSRRFELRRIRIESRFFNTPIGRSSDVTPALEELLSEMSTSREEGVDVRRRRVLTTLGNVRYQAACERQLVEDATAARGLFESAADAFRTAAADSNSMYAGLGLAQALWQLGQREAAIERFASVRPLLNEEFLDRIEPRTKLLARSCELLCCARVPSLGGEVAALYSNVVHHLGEVARELTVYSVFHHRNTQKGTFKASLDNFMQSLP